MKYVVVLGDGMADFNIEKLGNKTPLSYAYKPTIDNLAKISELGMCKTVPEGMPAGSDVANLSVMGYDPKKYYSGRSPLEAASIGIDLKDTDVTMRCNLVTLSNDEPYEQKTMVDYSSGEITTAEAKVLIEYLKGFFDDEELKLYSGVSYRHCLVLSNASVCHDLTPPHNISDKKITEYLPKGKIADKLLAIMKKSYELLSAHPINIERVKQGKNPANSVWFWGEGSKPALDNFEQKFGIKGAVISAVDLLKGIGKLTGMKVISVEGATGTYETNFEGKTNACIEALKNGIDYVYIHMEAPDECGHQGDLDHKIYSIEQIDKRVVKPLLEELKKIGDFRMLICPDHPTPISTKTHNGNPIPYLLYKSDVSTESGFDKYDECNCTKSGIFVENGFELILKMLNKTAN